MPVQQAGFLFLIDEVSMALARRQQTGDGGTGGLHVAFCSGRSSGRAAGPGAMPNVATMPASLSAAVTFGSRVTFLNGDNRFSLRLRQSRDAARYLAVRRLPVIRPFAGDDDIGPRARLACMQQIERRLDAGAHGRVEQAQHAAAGAAHRARARLICYSFVVP